MRFAKPFALVLVYLSGLGAGVVTFAAGDDASGPRSPRAKAAIKKYDRAVEKAREAYVREVARAAKELRAELEASIKTAMQAGSLDEAKALDAALRSFATPATTGRAKADVPMPVGTWEVVYGNGTRRTYAIDAQGRLSWGERRAQLVSTPHGVASPVGFEQGKRERYTLLADGRLLVEHFAPDSAFPAGDPDQVGLAVRQGATSRRP